MVRIIGMILATIIHIGVVNAAQPHHCRGWIDDDEFSEPEKSNTINFVHFPDKANMQNWMEREKAKLTCHNLALVNSLIEQYSGKMVNCEAVAHFVLQIYPDYNMCSPVEWENTSSIDYKNLIYSKRKSLVRGLLEAGRRTELWKNIDTTNLCKTIDSLMDNYSSRILAEKIEIYNFNFNRAKL